MDKIGIGVTSTNSDWYKRLDLVRPKNSIFRCNSDQISIAKDKNSLIKFFYDNDCQYIFLFDDDTFPIKEGWADFFINASKKTGIEHFVLCHPDHNKLIQNGRTIDTYQTGTGCFIFLTRNVIEKVGYINAAYVKYGYEHAGYSWRIHRAGFTPSWYVSVNGWEDYIYSWDLDKDSGSRHNFSRTAWDGEESKQDFIAINEDIFNKEITSHKIYYSFDLDISK
jgi:hypothetical protein